MNKLLIGLGLGGLAWLLTRKRSEPTPPPSADPTSPDFVGPRGPEYTHDYTDPTSSYFVGPQPPGSGVVQPEDAGAGETDSGFVGPIQPVDVPGGSEFVGPVQDPVYALAQRVAQDLIDKGPTRYDRALVKELQDATGIARDGLYGPETQATLIRYGVASQPPVYARKLSGGPSISEPKPSEFGSVDPGALALEVAANLSASSRTSYARDLMKLFQRQVGFPASGLYDGATRGALIELGADPATLPEPYVASADGSKATIAYYPLPEYAVDEALPMEYAG